MKTLACSGLTRLAVDTALVCAVIIGAAYVLETDAAATEALEIPQTLPITIQFLP